MRLSIKLFNILSICYLSNHSTLKAEFFFRTKSFIIKGSIFYSSDTKFYR